MTQVIETAKALSWEHTLNSFFMAWVGYGDFTLEMVQSHPPGAYRRAGSQRTYRAQEQSQDSGFPEL